MVLPCAYLNALGVDIVAAILPYAFMERPYCCFVNICMMKGLFQLAQMG